MHFLAILSFLALAIVAHGKQCNDLEIPFSLEARNALFDIEPIETNLDATRYVQRLTSNAGNYSNTALKGYAAVSGQYHLSAKYCRPDAQNSSASTLQFLTHGIGFDKLYWDLPYNDFNYSYVDVAVNEYAYSTIAINRFGIGNSSIANALDVVQAPAELAAIFELTQMLKEGRVEGVPAPKKIVHIGHSFGSELSFALASAHPTSSDGLVLTGFSASEATLNNVFAAFNSKVARLNQPLRFGDVHAGDVLPRLNETVRLLGQSLEQLGISVTELQAIIQDTSLIDLTTGLDASSYPRAQNLSSGYLVWADPGSLQYPFFYPNHFDPNILSYAESIKQPYTTGEFLTLVGSTPTEAPNFTGLVLVLTGNEDYNFCGGDCRATGNSTIESIPAQLKSAFPTSGVFDVYLQPNTGHAINLHYNSTGAYRVIQDFLMRNGLGPS